MPTEDELEERISDYIERERSALSDIFDELFGKKDERKGNEE